MRNPPSELQAVGLQVSLGFEGGHAAGPGRGHGLAIGEIRHVSRGEHAGDRGPGSSRRDLDVVVRQEIDLPLKSSGCGCSWGSSRTTSGISF